MMVVELKHVGAF